MKFKHFYLTTLMAGLLSMAGASAYAHDFEVANADGKTIYYVKESSTTVAVSYQGSNYDSYSNEYTGNVVIPETVTYNRKTYSVTSIGESAFYECSGLTSVTIPNSVTSIDDYAFYYCSGLTSVTIPNSVTSIGYGAFWCCSGLTSVTIGNSVTSIGTFAFFNCHLTSVTIPNSVTTIGNNAFEYCGNLTAVTIGNSVTSIGKGAFYGCGFTSIIIPNSVTSIGSGAFSHCSDLTSITIPNSVTSIGDAAFCWCSSLTSITIGNSVTSIGDGTFEHCVSLTSVTIGNSVTSIGSSAFSGCSSLTSVTIPNSVTKINEWAFAYCSGLTSIIVDSGSLTYDSRNNCNAIIESASNTLIAGCKSTVIPNSVTSIGEYAFRGSGLTSITIPNSVTSIGCFAFESCNSLKSITCLASIPPICGVEVFYGFYQSTCMLKVPEASIALYKAADQWKDFFFIEATGINAPTVDNSGVTYQYYDLNGKESAQPRKGMNIVRSSDGKTRKVVMK